MNLKLFSSHGEIYRFRRKFKKGSGEIKPLGVHRNMIISNWQYSFYYFVVPDLSVEIIFRKGRTAEKGGIDFEIVE